MPPGCLAVLPLLASLGLAAPPAMPAPARSYLAAREAYARELAAKSEAMAAAAEPRALADLERRLRELVGPVQLPGLAGEGRINLDTVVDRAGFAQVDGLRFDWNGDRLVVTPRALLEAYLAADRTLPSTLPAVGQAPAAFADFYSRAFASFASYEWFGDVPVRAGAAELALAALALPTEEWRAAPPTALVVAVVRGQRVLLLSAAVKPPLEPLPECEAAWKAGLAKAEAARAAGASARDQARLEEDAFDACRRCWAAALRERPAFAELTRRAQALVDALAR